MINDFKLYDIVEMKKEHPCSTRSKIFQIVRVGADIRLECCNCKRVIMMASFELDKRIKK
jgi:hypothetical protein